MRAVVADLSTDANEGWWPDVDVVMPIRDEADHLRAAVDAVRAQDYPGRMRIFLGLAPSSDDTAAVAATLEDTIVVPNPAGTTPAGLNVAIRAGSAPVVVRVDGHSELSPGYIRRAVTTMRTTGAVNVGGRQVPLVVTPFEETVATATTSWLGTGGATYRVGGRPGPVDTVFLGAFDRAAIEAVGLFDERLVRNQDYELNIRLRAAGGVVWFDPELWVGYRPRSSWTALARQYYEYGHWKAAVLRMHPDSLRLRQLLPPLGVAVTAAATVVGVRRRVWLALPIAGAVIVVAEAARLEGRSLRATARLSLALALIPTSWSLGLAGRALDLRP